jgi:predicted enzyme related to lactoylglutathione lyase
MNNPVSWFEIPVTDMDRAKQFYETIFGYEITLNEMGNAKMGWFPFDHTAPGSTGTLIQNENYTPSYHGSLVYFSVPIIDDVLAKVESAGGKIINHKFSIGEYGFCGHFEDTEGNRVALHQGVS